MVLDHRTNIQCVIRKTKADPRNMVDVVTSSKFSSKDFETQCASRRARDHQSRPFRVVSGRLIL